MLLWGSSAPYWVESFQGMQSPLALLLPSAFCLCPREPVGSAGFCVQILSRSCRCGPSQAARLLISQCAALGLWVGQLASAPDAHPPEVSGVGGQSANLGASNRGSQEHQGCLSHVHHPEAEGGGAPEAVGAAESSLTSP